MNFFEKIFCRNGKWLYLCTRFRRRGGVQSAERGCRKRAIIETDEREEIACVGLPEMPASRTRDESKVEKAILTMKSLILAQDER